MPGSGAALLNHVLVLKPTLPLDDGQELSLQYKPVFPSTATLQLAPLSSSVKLSLLAPASSADKEPLLHTILLPSTPLCKLSPQLTLLGLPEGSIVLKFASAADSAQFSDLVGEFLRTPQVAPASGSAPAHSTAPAAASAASEAPLEDVSDFAKKTDKSSSAQYFSYYGQLAQQQNMLQDYTRTGTYQRAMLENAVDFEGKIVVDVGAGTGVLSFFAIQAGAAKVYAIEASAMAENTKILVEKNGLKDRIIVINSKVEEVELPEKVDMIISEPMGTMLVNERMLESYIYARKWLKTSDSAAEGSSSAAPTAATSAAATAAAGATAPEPPSSAPPPAGTASPMFPSMAYLYCAPFSDEFLFMEQFAKTTFWFQNSFYGIDVSALQARATEEIFSQPVVDCIDPSVLGAPPVCKVFNFATVSEDELVSFEIPFEFKYSLPATVHGLAFWFDVSFNGSHSTVWLSTSPNAPLTHWYQLRCLVPQPLQIARGQTLVGNVVLRGNSRQSYDIELQMQVKGQNLVVKNRVNLKEPLYRYSGVSQNSAITQSSNQASAAAMYATGGQFENAPEDESSAFMDVYSPQH